MRVATRELLRRVCEAELLAEAGKVLEAGRVGVIVVTEWAEALRYSTSDEWESVQLRKQNELSSFLSDHARRESSQWNPLVDEIKAVLTPAIGEKRKRSVKAGKPWPEHVVYDLLAGCMETEFAELREPDYGMVVMEWYLKGRFPCGWGRYLPGGGIQLTKVPATNVPFTPENVLNWPVLEHLSGPLKRLELPGKLLVY